MTTTLKVGQLARRTGLTVRTLHHYDEIGLLRPGRRTKAGHRVYGDEEVRRLQQIASLRHLGLSLDEVRSCLARPDHSLDRVLELQLERIEAEIERHTRMRDLIRALRERLESKEGASVEEFTRAIEVTLNFSKYYTPEQMDQLTVRRAEVGEERIQQVQRAWGDLFTAYGEAMSEGLDPASPTVKELARRSAALIAEFTGGDPGIQASLARMYREEGGPKVLERSGRKLPDGLWEYMGRARTALAGDAEPATADVEPATEESSESAEDDVE
jgi:DNA-binding transcriptional MerR regulator